MNALVRDSSTIILTTREPPTAEVLEDDIYLTLPVAGPVGAAPASVDVFLTLEFARRTIAELQKAVEAATKSRL